MAFITFVTPYKPIICGIADYTHFIVKASPPDSCDVITFNLDNYGVPLHKDPVPLTVPVWYGIPSRDDFSASSILEGLIPHKDHVLWFQHEFGIWPDNTKFIEMIRNLSQVKVVTLHTLHFQSSQTPYGMRKSEWSFLGQLLPNTDAITVFSNGVYKAVTSAFPEYAYKVHILRHGTHLYSETAHMSRSQAKVSIHEYFMGDSELNQASKCKLKQTPFFLDQNTIVIGAAGFITASKGTTFLYQARNRLQQMLPQNEIAAVHVGMLREADNDNSIDGKYAADLRISGNVDGQFFFETYLPEDKLPIYLRALDIHFYWPRDCTQSGILAHALGVGAVIACRDMEGVGETVRLAGGLACKELDQLIIGLRELILDRKDREKISARSLRYANSLSWKNQVLQHFELADRLCNPKN
ncbi:hypothetical protein ACFLTS_02805 [Chloroflexota bacterium]